MFKLNYMFKNIIKAEFYEQEHNQNGLISTGTERGKSGNLSIATMIKAEFYEQEHNQNGLISTGTERGKNGILCARPLSKNSMNWNIMKMELGTERDKMEIDPQEHNQSGILFLKFINCFLPKIF
ncbi:hypothetical protein CEXT_599671 [Caerostris extrusa]|uniref:Uncharacterized protein n=1 Tax=Caerostris extrusa TaxID=172846 RepID=A0AAV4WBA4_CAEEX|nr:hypothetical protein CEXT_599671 [Caerostris extrusa]